MTFSIIIPAYNAAAYLPRCLDSILSQDFTDYEVIVIDDGSSDGTATTLKQYPKVKVISQSNHGMATARNRGLEMAQGDYILFVDSDDWLCDGALSILAPSLTGEDIVGFGSKIFNEQTKAADASADTLDEADDTYTNYPIAALPTMSGWDYFNRYRLQPTPVHFVCIWQRAYRREFLNDNHLRFEEGLRRAEDDLFTTMAMLHAKTLKTITECLYTYRIRQGSITRSHNPALDADSRRVQQILADTFVPLQGIKKDVIYQVLASNYINLLDRKGESLSPTEWHTFSEVSITPRHRRLYHLAHLHPALMRLYFKLRS